MENNTNKQKSGLLYFDEAAYLVSNELGIHLSEKHIKQIAKKLKLSSFKVGTRVGFSREDFEDKFPEFIALSTQDILNQTIRRTTGAENYNKKVDGVFAFVNYLFILTTKTHPFIVNQFLNLNLFVRFMRYYDSYFSNWTEQDLKEFIHHRYLRNTLQNKAETKKKMSELVEKGKADRTEVNKLKDIVIKMAFDEFKN